MHISALVFVEKYKRDLTYTLAIKEYNKLNNTLHTFEHANVFKLVMQKTTFIAEETKLKQKKKLKTKWQ